MRMRYLWLCAIGMLIPCRPALALPKFAREYGVACNQCHSVAPRLNDFGRAFQANNFNWPQGKQVPGKNANNHFPISGIAHFSYEDNRSEHVRTAQFRELELFFSDALRTGGPRAGGYYAALTAVTREKDGHDGDLSQAFAVLPVAGRRGQWTLGAGQFSPFMYQWDAVNELTNSNPAALGDDFDAISLAEPGPGVRVDYFDHRRGETADGKYLALVVPLDGHLAFNSRSRLNGPRGVFAHAFRREGPSSLGVFAYTRAGHNLGGVIGTHDLSKRMGLLGVASVGSDEDGNTRRLSVEGNYVAGERLAFTARLDALGGSTSEVGGAAAVTYYPLKLPVLRLTLETTQRKGDRSVTLFVRGQF
jgi:hypothetical protein